MSTDRQYPLNFIAEISVNQTQTKSVINPQKCIECHIKLSKHLSIAKTAGIYIFSTNKTFISGAQLSSSFNRLHFTFN